MTLTTLMTETIRAIAVTAEAAVAVASEVAAVAAVLDALAPTTGIATLRLTKAETLDKFPTGPSLNTTTCSIKKHSNLARDALRLVLTLRLVCTTKALLQVHQG